MLPAQFMALKLAEEKAGLNLVQTLRRFWETKRRPKTYWRRPNCPWARTSPP